MLEHVGEYGRRTLGRWFVLADAGLNVLALVALAYADASTVRLAIPWLIVGLLIVLVVSGFLTFHEERGRIGALPDVRLGIPILFPFEEVTDKFVVRTASERTIIVADEVRLYRIPVENVGADAPRVFVKLVKTSPPLAAGMPGPTLHLAGDNPKDGVRYERSRAFPLPKDDVEYIDVIAMSTHKHVKHGNGEYHLYSYYLYSIASANAAQRLELDSGIYVFAIGAFAGDTSAIRSYLVGVDREAGWLIVTPSPAA